MVNNPATADESTLYGKDQGQTGGAPENRSGDKDNVAWSRYLRDSGYGRGNSEDEEAARADEESGGYRVFRYDGPARNEDGYSDTAMSGYQ